MDNEISVISLYLSSFKTFRNIKRSFLNFIESPSRVGGFHVHPTKNSNFALFSTYLYRLKLTIFYDNHHYFQSAQEYVTVPNKP